MRSYDPGRAGGRAGYLSKSAHTKNSTNLCTPPPFVQATVNDKKLTDPMPRVAATRVLLMCRNLRDTRVDRPQVV